MAAQRRRLRRRCSVGHAAVLVSVVLAGALVSESLRGLAARDLFDEIYERGRAVDASWKTLTARFTEQSTSALLTQPLAASGTLAVARPDRVVLEYLEPDRRTVLIDRGTLRVAWPARGLRTERDISASQARVQTYFVDKTPQQLRRHFTIAARDAPDRAGQWHVALIPTDKRIREGVVAIDLWVDRQTLLLSAMAMTFPNGDRKLMEFVDVRLNPDLPPETFVLTRGAFVRPRSAGSRTRAGRAGPHFTNNPRLEQGRRGGERERVRAWRLRPYGLRRAASSRRTRPGSVPAPSGAAYGAGH